MIEQFKKSLGNFFGGSFQSEEGVDEKILNFINSLNFDFSPEAYDTSQLVGEYTVSFAYHAGSSYTNGWHVFCEKNDGSGIQVDFYQDGAFTAVIPHIKPI